MEGLDLSLSSLGSSNPVPDAPMVAQSGERRHFTDAELQAGVDAGTITQAVADQVQGEQKQAALIDGVATTIKNQRVDEDRATAVKAGLDSYIERFPQLKNKDSAHFKKAVVEFNTLVDLGYDSKDPGTELLSLKAAFGSADRASGVLEIESHPEGGSGQGEMVQQAGSEGLGDPGTPPSGLNDRQVAHYSHLIDIGVMPDWNTVREEQKYADPGIARRAAVMNG